MGIGGMAWATVGAVLAVMVCEDAAVAVLVAGTNSLAVALSEKDLALGLSLKLFATFGLSAVVEAAETVEEIVALVETETNQSTWTRKGRKKDDEEEDKEEEEEEEEEEEAADAGAEVETEDEEEVEEEEEEGAAAVVDDLDGMDGLEAASAVADGTAAVLDWRWWKESSWLCQAWMRPALSCRPAWFLSSPPLLLSLPSCRPQRSCRLSLCRLQPCRSLSVRSLARLSPPLSCRPVKPSPSAPPSLPALRLPRLRACPSHISNLPPSARRHVFPIQCRSCCCCCCCCWPRAAALVRLARWLPFILQH